MHNKLKMRYLLLEKLQVSGIHLKLGITNGPCLLTFVCLYGVPLILFTEIYSQAPKGRSLKTIV